MTYGLAVHLRDWVGRKRLVSRSAVFLSGWLGLFLGGCTATYDPPDLGGLYNRAAQRDGAQRNPVIVIPGILGSKLYDPRSGELVWGAFSGGAMSPDNPEGARTIALPMNPDKRLDELTDEVVADGALDQVTVNVFGLSIELNAYFYILNTLGAGGYRDRQLAEKGGVDYGEGHFTCFQFDYDWRRDIVGTAKLLHEFILARRAYVQEEIATRYGIENHDVKFDLVAHSMGGLVVRYYLRYGPADLPEDGSLPPLTWEGARYVDRVVMIATPNAGSVNSLIELVEGNKLGPFLPRYEPALLGTMPSVYQLLPRSRHGAVVNGTDDMMPITDIYDPALWEKLQWGLASPDQDELLRMLLPDVEDASERRRVALDHQAKSLRRAKQFTAAIDEPASPPPELTLHLIAGDAVPTDAVVAVNYDTGELQVTEKAPGDGTVLRTSALMDERVGRDRATRLESPIDWHRVTFLFKDHLGLTADPTFSDNLLFLLLEQPETRKAREQ